MLKHMPRRFYRLFCHYPKRTLQMSAYCLRRMTGKAHAEPELTWQQKWRSDYILSGCRSVRSPRGYFGGNRHRLRVIDDVRPLSSFFWKQHREPELPLPGTAASPAPNMKPWPAPEASFILSVNGGFVAPDGLVFDRRAVYRNGRWFYQPPPDFLPLERYDRLLTLVQLWSEEFVHFSFDTLPRIDMTLEFLAANDDVRILVPPAPFYKDVFRLLDIDIDRLVLARPDRVYSADEVYYPHFYSVGRPLKMGLLPLGSFRRVRKFLNQENSDPPDLIVYLKRNPPLHRQVDNEEEMLREISRCIQPTWKLKVYTPVNDWQKDRLIMQRARVVFGPHGGAWSNIVFCPDGVDVVEFSPLVRLRNAGQNERPCYYGLACGLGLRYWSVEPDNFHFDQPTAMRVPLQELMTVFRRMGVLG